MDQQTGTGKNKVMMIAGIVVIVIIAALAIWFFTKGKTETKAPAQTAAKVYAPKNADWAVYKSAKYGFNLSHPTDYVLAETGDKSINLTKGDKIMVELYVSSSGTEGAVALYTDEAKGYMTGGKAESVTIAGVMGNKVTGTFSKFGGNRMVFDGIKGSTTIFTQGNWTYYLNSYDNNDAAALAIFNDISYDLAF